MRLATDLTDGSAIPYFLWDEPLTVDELRRRLAGDDEEERVRLAAKVMREARFDEVMTLLPVAEIVADYPRLRSNLGRRLPFLGFPHRGVAVPWPHSLASKNLAGRWPTSTRPRGICVRGIAFERFEGLEQDRQGIWSSPSGARVAWFKDPDGNLLSITQV